MERNEYMEEIIYRHLNKEASDQEEAEILFWLQQDPTNKLAYDELLQIWEQSARLASEHYFNESAAWASFEKKISLTENENTIFKTRAIFRKSLSIAASFILLVLAAGLIYYIIWQNKPVEIIVSATQSNHAIQLPDGSSVTLRKGSSLKYDNKFGSKERVVQLSGEAYFNVKHDDNLKFRISTDQSIIEDLGTAFLVRSINGSDQVFVDKGSVRFTDIHDKSDEVVVSAGQKASLVGKVFDKESIADSNYLAWQNGILKFEQASLRSMIRDINDQFHANILLSDSLTAKSDSIKVNFRFEKNSLDEILDEISLTTGLKVEKSSNRIFLH